MAIIIGICDDEKIHRDQIRDLCEQYFEACPQKHGYVEFSSGEEVLAYPGERMVILFLDIEMGDVSGLDVLERLQKSDFVWRIAFVSSHKEKCLDTIDVKTLAFLEKPVTFSGVKKCLSIALRENAQNKTATFTVLEGKKDVELSDIVYIQADRHYVSVFAKKSDFTGYDSLKQYEEQLKGTTMVRIHKSYLVNLQYVKKLFAEEVLMTDGRRLPIGRKYNTCFKESYFNFIRTVTMERNDAK